MSLLPSILWGTNFSGADLSNADFTQTLLSGLNFSDSPRRSTNLTNVRWPVEQLR
ncbi:pentapeptide repeat-containing protein [Oscillatoria sp. CS-180]|uniref:pentapeptide repeat-containing protein n=1 Tax=Oscillatoria sp. CS-180 TaxID=3021720 RepID=UPI00232AAE42|nr:pentapeptide repeat-containing protein [Oscillatoria sp. CS-180]MDB9529637.1 pentapeptide repeat-containing protein [Oscillatoria sp. CS-180]